MKIEADLRHAIKSAEKAQPYDGYKERVQRESTAIAALFNRKPALGRTCIKLAADAKRFRQKAQEADKALCEKYGIVLGSDGWQIAGCGDGKTRFEKAGGKLNGPHQRWTYDNIMARLAAATEKEGAAIIKSIGINWA